MAIQIGKIAKTMIKEVWPESLRRHKTILIYAWNQIAQHF